MRPVAALSLAVVVTSAAALASSAQATVVVNPVSASVSFSGTGGSLNYSAAISKQASIGDTGTLIGQYGTNAAIRGRWSAQAVGGAADAPRAARPAYHAVTTSSVVYRWPPTR